MEEVYSKIIKIFEGDNKEGVKIVRGIVKGTEPLIIYVGGVKLPQFKINKDIVPEEGDVLLGIMDEDDVYLICKVG